MAWLITQACPFVKIYVAKVDAVQNEHLPHPSFKTSEAVKVSSVVPHDLMHVKIAPCHCLPHVN